LQIICKTLSKQAYFIANCCYELPVNISDLETKNPPFSRWIRDFIVVPETGVEPVRCCHRGILSPTINSASLPNFRRLRSFPFLRFANYLQNPVIHKGDKMFSYIYYNKEKGPG